MGGAQDDCRTDELDDLFALSPGSVKTHLKRGLESLRAQDGRATEVNSALAP